jgi:hypothetical protein
MRSVEVHPESGLHYVHLIPTCPAYQDVGGMLSSLAARCPWISIAPVDAFGPIQDSADYQNPRLMFVLWGGAEHAEPRDRSGRKAKLALFYCETLGDPALLHSDQRAVLERFSARAYKYDLVFAHTPTAVAWLERNTSARASLMPSGYDPEVQGRPMTISDKRFDLVFYGARMNRRERLRELERRFRVRYADVSGVYGPNRHRMLNDSRAILQIHHAPPSASFAAFRLWQAVGTSAALLMEPIDAWPAQPSRHYLEFLPLESVAVEDSARAIESLLDRKNLEVIARRAAEELSRFTPQYCMEHFLVPASAVI